MPQAACMLSDGLRACKRSGVCSVIRFEKAMSRTVERPEQVQDNLLTTARDT